MVRSPMIRSCLGFARCLASWPGIVGASPYQSSHPADEGPAEKYIEDADSSLIPVPPPPRHEAGQEVEYQQKQKEEKSFAVAHVLPRYVNWCSMRDHHYLRVTRQISEHHDAERSTVCHDKIRSRRVTVCASRWRGITMPNDLERDLELVLERQLADAHARIREMIQEIDRRDEMIADLQRRIEELEQARTPPT